MATPLIIGVDPGVTGAVAFLKDSKHKTLVHDLPVSERTHVQSYSKCLDAVEFYKLLNDCTKDVYTACKHPPVILVTEVMQSLGHITPPKVLTMLAEMASAIETTIRLWCWNNDIPLFVRKIQPTRWTHWMFPDGESRKGRKAQAKGESLNTARMLFPGCNSDLTRKKDNDRAEALLLSFVGAAEISGCYVESTFKKLADVLMVYNRFSQNSRNNTARFTDIYDNTETGNQRWLPEINNEIRKRLALQQQIND
jgi:hypothetical protein